MDSYTYMTDIDTAVKILRKGGLILYPTDTVWGIGCDATNSDAVRRVFSLKKRADSKALITLVSDTRMLSRTVEYVPDAAMQLIEVSERPVTIVYDHGCGVADELLAPDGSLAVRVTAEEFSHALCRKFGRPIVSTSANISGQPTPRCFNMISQDIISGVDYVCQSRRYEKGSDTRPSMIIKISDNGVFKFLRK